MFNGNPFGYWNPQNAGMQEIDQLRGNEAIGGARSNAANAAQLGALGMYQDAADGNAPSVAQAQLAQQSEQNIAGQMAMMNAGRGGNIGATAQQATQAGTAAQANTNQQMAMLRASEIDAARAGLAGMANTMQGQALQQQLGYAGLAANRQGQVDSISAQLAAAEAQAEQNRVNSNRQFGMQLGQMGAGAIGGAMGIF